MPALNYTTKVPVTRTVGEIQDALAKRGAQQITTQYTDGNPTGLAFQMLSEFGNRFYILPVNVTAMGALLTRQRKDSPRVDARPEQAARVAWRVVKDWLEAQLALIDAQMATLDQVMLPYLVMRDGRTLHDHAVDYDLSTIAIEGPS